MKENEIKENKMGVMPVNKLLVTMSLPMILSMLVQALYNIVDSMFVSRISENAFTAVSLAFPLQMLMIAVGTGTGVGINAMLSKALGAKQQKKVNKIAANGIILVFVSYLLFLIIGICFVGKFYESQTNITEILDGGKAYLTICCCFSLGLLGQLIFEKLLQSTGKTIQSMIIQLVGAVINMILDPILIFGLFGMPAMGVAGAAIATVIGQTIAAIIALILNVRYNREIEFSINKLVPDFAIIKRIYTVGIPCIIMQAIGSLMVYVINLILISFSSTATAVFGAYFKLQSFIFLPVFGLNNGMISIIAYNYGAGKRKRVISTIKLSFIYGEIIMLIGFLCFQLFPVQLLLLFKASDAMLEIGVPAMKTISLSFLFAGFCFIAGAMFQALGNAMYSMIASIARQLVVLVPVAYALSLTKVLNYVWWAFPIAEVMSLFMSILFLCLVYKKVIKKIPNN